jgi:hypothetical protein
MPTRGAVFEPLVALAMARVVTLVEARGLAADDGEFLLRALIDLESDGIELFGAACAADDAFYTEIAAYLAARVGTVAAEASVLGPASAEAIAAAPCGRELDRAVLELISNQGGRA